MAYRMEQGGVGDPVISPEDWQLIFGGFDDVYRFQHRLLQELEAEWNSQVLVLRMLREQNMEHDRLPRQARDRHKVVKEYDGTDTQRRAFRHCSRTQLATVAAEKLKPPEGVCYKQRPTLRTWPARYVRIEVSEQKRHFLFTVYIKPIILPRQARDKHRGNTPKSAVFLQGSSFNVYDKDSWDKFAMGGGAGKNAFSMQHRLVCQDRLGTKQQNKGVFFLQGRGHHRVAAPSPSVAGWRLSRRVRRR